MKYFTYQQNGAMGKVWSLFSGLADISVEEKVKPNLYSCNYAHTLEIVNAAISGSLSTEEENLNVFNLKAYEGRCSENDKINTIRQTEKILYIVDNIGDEETGVGFGDISERKLKSVNDSFQILEDMESFESNLQQLYNIRKKYITENGLDLVSILLSSLKGIPEAVEEIGSILRTNLSLRDLITSLCEESQDGLLIQRLEMVL